MCSVCVWEHMIGHSDEQLPHLTINQVKRHLHLLYNVVGWAQYPCPLAKRCPLQFKWIIGLYSPLISLISALFLFVSLKKIALSAYPFGHYPKRMILAPAFNYNMEEMDNWKATPRDNVRQSLQQWANLKWSDHNRSNNSSVWHENDLTVLCYFIAEIPTLKVS